MNCFVTVQGLANGVDIVVGTPGRIFDLIQRGKLNLSQIDHIVLDEVDRMLDMGFAEDVDNVLKERYREGSSFCAIYWPFFKLNLYYTL